MSIQTSKSIANSPASVKATRAKYIVPSADLHPAVITDVKLANKRNYKTGKDEDGVAITFMLLSGDPTKAVIYPFQYDATDPNDYGLRVWKTVRLKIYNGDTSGGDAGFLTLTRIIKAALNEDKPLSDEQVRYYKEDISRLNDLIGKPVQVLLEHRTVTDADGNATTKVDVKLVSFLSPAKRAKVAGLNKNGTMVAPTFVRTEEQIADLALGIKYADTGETATGYYQYNAVEDKWDYVSVRSAQECSIEKYGAFYSPQEQYRRKKQAPQETQKDKTLPF